MLFSAFQLGVWARLRPSRSPSPRKMKPWTRHLWTETHGTWSRWLWLWRTEAGRRPGPTGSFTTGLYAMYVSTLSISVCMCCMSFGKKSVSLRKMDDYRSRFWVIKHQITWHLGSNPVVPLFLLTSQCPGPGQASNGVTQHCAAITIIPYLFSKINLAATIIPQTIGLSKYFNISWGNS